MNAESARATLLITLDTVLRLFAPFLPFTTEETWSWFNNDSIHTSHWPQTQSLQELAPDGKIALLTTATEALRMIRKAKSEAKRSMRAEVASASFAGTPEMEAYINLVAADLKAAGSIDTLRTTSAPDVSALKAQIVLAEQ